MLSVGRTYEGDHFEEQDEEEVARRVLEARGDGIDLKTERTEMMVVC